MANGHAYVTLLLEDTYLPGALVLAHSLRDAGTSKELAILVTLDTVSADAITQLKTVYDHILPVPRIRNGQTTNLQLMNRPNLHSAFTKINLWRQMQFSKIVYLDADVVALRAPDELFSRPASFSAAPDIGWPDLFNSGVMVLTPDLGHFYAMLSMANHAISFDGADQGLLNMYFGDRYDRLSFTYNVTPSAHYQYLPAYHHFQASISMIHFIGSDKPWTRGRQHRTGDSSYDGLVGRWWTVYDRHYRTEELELTPEDLATAPDIVRRAVKGEYKVGPVARSTNDYEVEPDRHEQIHTYREGHSAGDHGRDPGHDPGHYHEQLHREVYHPHHKSLPPGNHHSHEFHPTVKEESNQPQPSPENHHQRGVHRHHRPDQASRHDFHRQAPSDDRHEQVPSHHECSHRHSHHVRHETHHPERQTPVASSSHQGRDSSSSLPRTLDQASDGHNPPREESVPSPAWPNRDVPQPEVAQVQSWDAQWHPPPADSKPEAPNLPQVAYKMSEDPRHFIPPERYPSPPKNLWYNVPQEPPAPPSQPPPQIFPWERQQTRPTRVFPSDYEPPNPLDLLEPSRFSSNPNDRGSVKPGEEPIGIEFFSHQSGGELGKQEAGLESESESKSDPILSILSPSLDTWANYAQVNAWDDHPDIEQYMSDLQRRNSTLQGRGILGGNRRPGLLSRKSSGFGPEIRGPRLTDWPIDRPSLSVTPVPIRPQISRNDGDGGVRLPIARGVPVQSDWDPLASLEKLASEHSDVLLRRLNKSGGRHGASGEAETSTPSSAKGKLKDRDMPFGSGSVRRNVPSQRASWEGHVQDVAGGVLSPRPVKGQATSSILRDVSGKGSEQEPASLIPKSGSQASRAR